MESNREVFLKMSEDHYMDIPSLTREMWLTSKRIDSDTHDWQENMNDVLFEMLYKKKKEVTKQLEERQYELRELRLTKKK
jgi:hypothetical protein